MVRRVHTLCALFLLSPLFAWGQRTPSVEGTTFARVMVRVTYSDDRPAKMQLRVQLLTGSEQYTTEAFTDDQGQVEFSGVQPGTYRIRVSGMGIQETTTGAFTISRSQNSHTEFVRVERAKNADGSLAVPEEAMVSAADLNVPGKARKEYEKGGKAMEEGKWGEARARFEKAISLYPQYAAAHNDLGVVYMNTGERERGRAMFEKAIAINGRYARAHRNLGLLLFQEKRYAEAGTSFDKALATEPLDAQTLTMLAQVQLLLHKPEAAAATATKVHAVPHEQFAACHLIAARAYEAMNKETDAMAEYTIFLRESPNNPNAPRVQAALDALKARTR
ncbi:MAG TPA: tetratricopeptide repeat protein [Terriglobales bacterium]|nr:tetratricopeptide repeat protein [Terriglobales bacterium]